MKKSLILAGLLSIGYAYTQTQEELRGRMGLNTASPNATLEVKVADINASNDTNQGVLIPKLTKTRVAGIADSKLVKGTLVFVEGTIYSGANTKVVDINADGFYYYNGTKWVRVEGSVLPSGNANGQVLKWNGTAWVLGTDTDTTYTAGTGLTLSGTTFSANPAGIALGGDVTGNANANTVAKLQGRAVANTAPTNGQVLKWNQAEGVWKPENDANANTTYTGSTSVVLSGTSFQRAALTGDVTSAVNNNTVTINTGAVTSAKIADGTITGADIANGTITADKLAAGVNTNIYTNDGTLSTNRKVTTGANALTIEGTAYHPLQINANNGTGSGGLVIRPMGNQEKRIEMITTPEGNLRLWAGRDVLYALRTNGNVGIGTNNPTKKLHVDGGEIMTTWKDGFRWVYGDYGMLSTNDGNNFYLFPTSQGNPTGPISGNRPFTYHFATKNLLFMTGAGDGNIGIGTTTPAEKLAVVGNVAVSGFVKTASLDLNSDKRLKTNINTIPDGKSVERIKQLNPVTYYWNTEGKAKGGNDKLQYGLIAQEVEKVFPEMVNTDKEGYKSVNYIELIPVLLKAVQEQQKEIEVLKKKIK